MVQTIKGIHTIAAIGQLIVIAMVGAIPWMLGYLLQRLTPHHSPKPVAVPRWLVWIFGNPRGDGTVKIASACSQMVGIVITLTGLVTVIAGSDNKVMSAVWGLIAVIGILITLVSVTVASIQESV